MRNYRLVINYGGKVITVPFPKIENLDAFTVLFDDLQTLGETINKILNLRIRNVRVNSCHISYNGMELPVKLSHNDFDVNDVINQFITYVSKNYDIVSGELSGFSNLVENYLRRVGRDVLLETDIDRVVRNYLNTYRRQRDAYFELIDHNYRVRKVKYDVKSNNKLTNYDTDHEYFEYLISYSKLGNKEYDEAMELLSLYDLDEIRSNMHGNPGLFDGIRDDRVEDSISILDEELALRELANMDLKALETIVKRYAQNNNGRRR